MKRTHRILCLLAVILLFPLFITSAFAWGPEREEYTTGDIVDHATFNSVTDNPTLGDERDFVRIVRADSEEIFTSELILEADQEYEVMIYFHNCADISLNDFEHNYVGLARDTRVIADFPAELKQDERQAITGYITSTSTEPQTVWDEAYITAKEPMNLIYVPESAKIFTDWDTNEAMLPETLFSPDGAFIGLNELDGLILGGYEFSGMIRFRIRTIADKSNIIPWIVFGLFICVILAIIALYFASRKKRSH